MMEVITVTSQAQNAAQFISNFSNLINVTDEYEVGLLKIAHPPVANITNDNREILLGTKDGLVISGRAIPVGYYGTTHEIGQAICDSLQEEERSSEDTFTPLNWFEVPISLTQRYQSRQTQSSVENNKMIIELKEKDFYFVGGENVTTVLSYLDYKMSGLALRGIVLNNEDVRPHTQIAFLYSSIVSNSLIDSRLSRLLDTVELKTERNEHSLFEVKNPVFHKVSAASFIDITFEIRNVNGELINFHGDLPTILTLGIRKKQN